MLSFKKTVYWWHLAFGICLLFFHQTTQTEIWFQFWLLINIFDFFPSDSYLFIPNSYCLSRILNNFPTHILLATSIRPEIRLMIQLYYSNSFTQISFAKHSLPGLVCRNVFCTLIFDILILLYSYIQSNNLSPRLSELIITTSANFTLSFSELFAVDFISLLFNSVVGEAYMYHLSHQIFPNRPCSSCCCWMNYVMLILKKNTFIHLLRILWQELVISIINFFS